MSGVSKGMSSELEAIMNRRLAKSEGLETPVREPQDRLVSLMENAVEDDGHDKGKKVPVQSNTKAVVVNNSSRGNIKRANAVPFDEKIPSPIFHQDRASNQRNQRTQLSSTLPYRQTHSPPKHNNFGSSSTTSTVDRTLKANEESEDNKISSHHQKHNSNLGDESRVPSSMSPPWIKPYVPIAEDDHTPKSHNSSLQVTKAMSESTITHSTTSKSTSHIQEMKLKLFTRTNPPPPPLPSGPSTWAQQVSPTLDRKRIGCVPSHDDKEESIICSEDGNDVLQIVDEKEQDLRENLGRKSLEWPPRKDDLVLKGKELTETNQIHMEVVGNRNVTEIKEEKEKKGSSFDLFDGQDMGRPVSTNMFGDHIFADEVQNDENIDSKFITKEDEIQMFPANWDASTDVKADDLFPSQTNPLFDFDALHASDWNSAEEGKMEMGTDELYEPPHEFNTFESQVRPEDYIGNEDINECEEEGEPSLTEPQKIFEPWTMISDSLLTPAQQNTEHSPTMNPITGNIILARIRNGCWNLDEIDMTNRHRLVSSITITVAAIRRSSPFLSSAGMIPYGISRITNIVAGKREGYGQSNLYVAAMVRLKCFGTNKKLAKSAKPVDVGKETVDVIVLWNWDSHTICLQNVVSTPSFPSIYEGSTLCVSEDLIFLGGSYQSTPAIYLVDTTVQNMTWSTHLLQGKDVNEKSVEAPHIVSLVVGCRNFLAISKSDNNVEIWAYSKISYSTTKSEEYGVKPICNLNTEFLPQRLGDDTESCTHFAWLELPGLDDDSSIILLGVALCSGTAVYNVSGFLTFDEKVEKESIQPSKRVEPFFVKEFPSECNHSSITWFELGPGFPPCLSIAQQKEGKYSIEMGAFSFRKSLLAGNTSFVTFCQSDFISNKVTSTPISLYPTGVNGLVASYCNGNLLLHKCSFGYEQSLLSSKNCLTQPIVSNSLGLNSRGQIFCQSDNILHIHSGLHLPHSSNDANIEEGFNVPAMRHLLCKINMGDNKNRKSQIDGEITDKGVSTTDDYNQETGGTITNAVCFLPSNDSTSLLIPTRIARDEHDKFCAVMFKRLSGTDDEGCDPLIFTDNSISYAVIDLSKSRVSELCRGRDIAFVRDSDKIIVLRSDNLNMISITDHHCQGCAEEDVRIFPEGSIVDTKVKVFRLFMLSSNVILFIASRKSDSTNCIFPVDFLSNDKQKVPKSLSQGSIKKLWFDPGEQFVNLVELAPFAGSKRSNISILTTCRILIVGCSDRALTVLSEKPTHSLCRNLVAMGSHCVAFCECSRKSAKLSYLSCSDGIPSHRIGTICTVSIPAYQDSSVQPLAIRPDRFIYLCSEVNSKTVKCVNIGTCYSVPIALTRPVSVLEPLIANTLGQMNARESYCKETLYLLLERFGRNSKSALHGEMEGIGTSGIGITSKAIELLHAHGCNEAISLLLKGNKNNPWILAATKASVSIGYLNQDISSFVHGDSDLGHYLQDPSRKDACVVPMPSDPSSQSSKKCSHSRIQEGELRDTIRLLDINGSPSSEQGLSHIGLSLQMNSADEMLNFICESQNHEHSCDGSAGSIAALLLNLRKSFKNGEQLNYEEQKTWMCHLAPSNQKALNPTRRPRKKLLVGQSGINALFNSPSPDWKFTLNEQNHIWYVYDGNLLVRFNNTYMLLTHSFDFIR